jgi:formamidopyrimidine-DNA glycosylase
MFELPEATVLARQLAQEISGASVASCVRGNSPHKFVWYNLAAAEYEALAAGKVAGRAEARAKWILLPMEPGHVQVFGEFGGRVLLHPAGAPRPARHHLLLEFGDGRALTAMTQMWGFLGLMTPAEVAGHKHAGGIGVTPVDPGFTPEYFGDLLSRYPKRDKRSVKALLTQDNTIPGVGNSYCQDILFRARLHPRRPVAALNAAEVDALYRATVGVIAEAISKGGRNDEVDLYGRPGGYARVMDRAAAGNPCPVCGAIIQKIQYLGGACYLCPSCQRAPDAPGTSRKR